MKRILFICSQNKLRSPTGEAVFGNLADIEARSAGLKNNSETPLGVEDVQWADIIFVMERSHKKKLQQQFKASLKDQRVICLDIPDNYQYMQPELVEIFQQKVPQYLNLDVTDLC